MNSAYRKATKDFASHQSVTIRRVNMFAAGAYTIVDGYFSLLKRGVVGTFHHISEQPLAVVSGRVDHRHNTRFLTDGERTVLTEKSQRETLDVSATNGK